MLLLQSPLQFSHSGPPTLTSSQHPMETEQVDSGPNSLPGRSSSSTSSNPVVQGGITSVDLMQALQSVRRDASQQVHTKMLV